MVIDTTSISPLVCAIIGSILWLILVGVATFLSFKKEKSKQDEKIIMAIWDLVKVFGGLLFGFIFGGK